MARRTWLANAFSPSMISGAAYLFVSPLPMEDFVSEVRAALSKKSTKCIIGHEGTAKLLAKLLGVGLDCKREQVTVDRGDVIYVISLSFRPPEGKVYSYNELLGLMRDGKIRFWRVEVLPGDCICEKEAETLSDEEVLGSIFNG